MTDCIAFHSYKGGTGKTTIASNLSAYLAKQGFKVVLLDLDLYSPSLHTYFKTTAKKSINDYLYSSYSNVQDIIADLSFAVSYDKKTSDLDKVDQFVTNNSYGLQKSMTGRFLVGFSNSNMENLQRLDVSGIDSQKHFFRKLVMFRDQIISKFNPDYIILDTSPGIRFWSLNALAISDIFFLTLKVGDIDINGTKIMIKEIYESFINSGTKSFLLWNKVSGYCVPVVDSSKMIKAISDINIYNDDFDVFPQELSFADTLNLTNLASIPCYCDIQFKKREFLTSIFYPEHPFSHEIELLAKKMNTELEDL
jgi:chromosome partitioning protein